MALPEEPLSIVEQWKRKSIELSSESNDTVVLLLSRGIETMAVVLNKKSDLNRVQRALTMLECERSVSLHQFDKIKNDDVNSLVHGLIESLHFTLSELTKERNQVKECGVMFTQTDQDLFDPSLIHVLPSNETKESAEVFTQTDQEPIQPFLDHPILSVDYPRNDGDYSHEEQPMIPPNLFELPKGEPFDESSIKIEDLCEDALEIKDEEMPNDNVETSNANEDTVGDRGDVSNIPHDDDMAQSEMPALEYMGDESYFENEGVDETMNDSKVNEIMGEDTEQDSSDIETVKVEKRRSSRKASKPVRLADNESLDYSDDDSGPIMKKRKKELSKMKKKSPDTVEKKGGSLSSQGKSREMKCTECEFQTRCPGVFTKHLRCVHFTTLKLAGLALRCDCGAETFSEQHKYKNKCDIANFTVVRKRDGPIQTFNDEKSTPQCILCEVYPKSACGYIYHLKNHHNSTASANGIYLVCSCGAKYRNVNPDFKHTKECTRRKYSLHKAADK